MNGRKALYFRVMGNAESILKNMKGQLSMRIVRNYGASILDYMDDNSTIKDILSQKANGSRLSPAAMKTLQNSGITLDGNSNSSKDNQLYTSIKDSTENLRTNIIKITNTEKDSLFAKAESSGKTSEVVKEIEGFVDNYNKMFKSMSNMGGDANTTYAKELSALVEENKDALEKIGITQNKDGSLEIDEEKLNAAAITDLKEAFAGKSEFAEKIANKSIYVEANAISAMYSSMISNYNGSGGFADPTLSSFLQSI